MQSLWTLYHNDGCKIIRATILPIPASLIGCGDAVTCYNDGVALNAWTVAQHKNPTIATPYYDLLVDVTQVLPDTSSTYLYNSDHSHPTTAGNAIQVGLFDYAAMTNQDAPVAGPVCFNSNGCATTGANSFSGVQTITAPSPSLFAQNSNGATSAVFQSTGGSVNWSDIQIAPFYTSGYGGFLCHWDDSIMNGDSHHFRLGSSGCSDSIGLGIWDSGVTNGPTAPTGSCPVNGVRQFTDDGKTTLCSSGTWTDITNGGGGGVVGGSVSVSGGTQAANTCSTNATATDTGLTTSGANSRVVVSYTGDPSAVVGWGSTGGMVFQAWGTSANTVTWHICNQTGSPITYGAVTFGLGAN